MTLGRTVSHTNGAGKSREKAVTGGDKENIFPIFFFLSVSFHFFSFKIGETWISRKGENIDLKEKNK